jgi:hypothetical protein
MVEERLNGTDSVTICLRDPKNYRTDTNVFFNYFNVTAPHP